MEKFQLYGGDVVLEFDERSHRYFLNRKPVPNVTTILSYMNKPALVGWAARMGAEHFAQRLRDIAHPDDIDEVFIEQVRQEAEKAHEVHRDKAGHIGHVAHKFAEDYIGWKLRKNKKPRLPRNPEARSASNAFIRWTKAHEIKWIASEFKVYSRKHHYTGTVDALAVVDGVLCIIDFKTNKSGIYPEHVLQVSAYAMACFEERGQRIEGAWVINIRKEDADLVPVPIDRETLLCSSECFIHTFQAWMNMKEVNSRLRKIKNNV